jgi:disulfide bond formation protein DsbB
MAEVVIEETRVIEEPAERRGGVWGFITYWGLHAWVAAYTVVMLSAFFIQFVKGEFPCPLCMLQRYGMILSTLGALFVIMQARRGTLTTARYAQGLGLGLLGVLAGASVSVR